MKFHTHFVLNPVHQNFTKIPSKLFLDKVPLESIENRERIEYLECRHKVITWKQVARELL